MANQTSKHAQTSLNKYCKTEETDSTPDEAGDPIDSQRNMKPQHGIPGCFKRNKNPEYRTYGLYSKNNQQNRKIFIVVSPSKEVKERETDWKYKYEGQSKRKAKSNDIKRIYDLYKNKTLIFLTDMKKQFIGLLEEIKLKTR